MNLNIIDEGSGPTIFSKAFSYMQSYICMYNETYISVFSITKVFQIFTFTFFYFRQKILFPHPLHFEKYY